MTGLEVALRPPPVAETVKSRSSALFPKITLTRLIRSNYLRNLHGLVLAGHYFWVQNLGSSVREQSAVWNKEHKEVHSCTTQGDYISDGERVTVKTKVDRRKQLFLGRALMTLWRWTSRIGEDGSMTYSNFSVWTDKTAETLVGHRQTRLNVLVTRKNKNTEQISAP